MAAPVEFRHFTPADTRADLIRRVEAAPDEHAEAVLAGYELLEQLHDKEVLNLLIGLLKSKDTVINHVVGVISSPGAVTGLRLALMMANKLNELDGEKLHAALNPVGDPPSMFAITKQMMSKDVRRALGVMNNLLSIFGAALGPKSSH